ncbi:hypothetical protein VTK73DRAFT_3660 [Phialemonium thermophilum]|uniref:Uncharacterized protein n=1 Tax=Phialemonium thermophilum TaxID=223376 RepID=A0ABR3VG77_9PEZI
MAVASRNTGTLSCTQRPFRRGTGWQRALSHRSSAPNVFHLVHRASSLPSGAIIPERLTCLESDTEAEWEKPTKIASYSVSNDLSLRPCPGAAQTHYVPSFWALDSSGKAYGGCPRSLASLSRTPRGRRQGNDIHTPRPSPLSVCENAVSADSYISTCDVEARDGEGIPFRSCPVVPSWETPSCLYG